MVVSLYFGGQRHVSSGQNLSKSPVPLNPFRNAFWGCHCHGPSDCNILHTILAASESADSFDHGCGMQPFQPAQRFHLLQQ